MAATRHGFKQGNGTLSHWYMGSIGSTKQVLLTYQSYNEPAAAQYEMALLEARMNLRHVQDYSISYWI